MNLRTSPPGAHRWRPSRGLAVGLLLLAGCGSAPKAPAGAAGGSTHLFVWAWDVDHDAGAFLAVVDADRSSATYGQVVSTLPTRDGSDAALQLWRGGLTDRPRNPSFKRFDSPFIAPTSEPA